MSTWSIEVNDAALQLVGPHGLRAAEPGYALIDGDQVLLGHAARAQCRLRPRQAFTEFWRDLASAPLADPAARGRSSAELGALQLGALWAMARETDPAAQRVLLVVPGEFDRAKLGVLLGAAEAARLPVAGVVDSAVAASDRCYPGWQLLHLDLGLHHLRLTQLSQSEGVRRSRFEVLPDAGLLALRDRWLRAIAERFIAETRYDPLHNAASEQQLHNRLDVWLLELRKADVLELTVETPGGAHSVELPRRDLLAATESIYQSAVRWIAQRRAPGAPVVLQVRERLAELPGLLEALERLEDTAVVRSAETAPGAGALAREEAIARPGSAPALVVQLPCSAEPVILPPPARRATPRSGPRATHVAYRGLAHGVGKAGFAIGTAEVSAGLGLCLAEPEPLAGISRQHCVVLLRDGELVLQDQSRYGTFVNEARVAGELALRPGDVIRLGTPGVELQVIGVVDANEA